MHRFSSRARPSARLLTAVLVLTILPSAAAQADRARVCDGAPSGVFADVPDTSTHTANIDCVAAYGITVGVGGGNYDPSGSVSRGQMASFLVNFIEVARDGEQSEPSESAFDDIGGTTHARNIRIAHELELTSGRTISAFEPAGRVTRAQMATFVAQVLRAAGAELAAGTDRFGDDDGSIHEANIDALAAAGIVAGTNGTSYDPTAQVTRAQMATFLANAAGHLSEQERWLAPRLPVEGPRAVLVVPSGAAMDSIEIQWDQPVTSTAVGTDFEVADAANADRVARGQTLTSPTSETMRVTLDTPLVDAESYWLRIADGIATDADGKLNTAHAIAFHVAAVTEADPAPVAPTVTSIITEPGESQLVVTFDSPVTCPTTASGASAWSFTNSSVVEDGTHAQGHPEAVGQSTPPSTTCELIYSTDGVEDGDFGTMTYTQPANEAHRVTGSNGVPLATVADITVTDGVAPSFESFAGAPGSKVQMLTFSEPVACSTLDTSPFEVSINPSASDPFDVDVDIANCAESPASSSVAITLSVAPASGDVVEVSIVSGATLADQSLHNMVAAVTRSHAVA